MRTRKLVYIAGKFRDENPYLVERNIRVAEEALSCLIDLGIAAICPHTNYRFFDKYSSDNFFINATLEMLRRCDAVYLCPGWTESRGAILEKGEAESLETPVFEDLEKLRRWFYYENDGQKKQI